MSPSLYWSTHRSLERARGSASTHQCQCGQPAKDWAYQHNSPDFELVEDGLVFSLNPDDYAPMCRPCHAALDQTGLKIGPKTSATQRARLATDPAFRELKETVARETTRARVNRATGDPEFAEFLRESSVRGAKTGARVRRQCSECGIVSHPVGIGKHQKATGHTRWEVIVP